MKVKQLSIFMENRAGRLAEIARRLGEARINIRALSLADTSDFGILRLIVNDVDKAMKILRDSGHTVSLTEVVAVEVPDRPGGLAGVLELFENSGVNIEYMYAFTFGRQDKAVLIFRFDQPDEAIRKLQGAGINVLDSVDVYSGGTLG